MAPKLMALPDISRDRVLLAIADYDRRGVEYAWPTNKFALVYNGRPYPPKVIVSLATGLPVSAFSGGEGSSAANPWLRRRGFVVQRIDGTPNGNAKRVASESVQTTEDGTR